MTNANSVPASSQTSTSRKTNFYSSQKYFPLFLIAPSLLIIGLVIIYPMLYSTYVSFTPFHLLRPEETFVFATDTMFRNYVRLFGNDVFWRSLFNTVIFLTLSVNISFILALAISQLLARVTRGQSMMRTLLMVPMMFAPVLVGFQFAWFFNATVGLVNNALLSLGILSEPKPWLV
ncbi:MAG: sugar ABC transporter permease, partial [Deltaproteobacteria bacterium]|nr:sugar ABC transporter permease [Deltaproteobacteria bacterium]